MRAGAFLALCLPDRMRLSHPPPCSRPYGSVYVTFALRGEGVRSVTIDIQSTNFESILESDPMLPSATLCVLDPRDPVFDLGAPLVHLEAISSGTRVLGLVRVEVLTTDDERVVFFEPLHFVHASQDEE